MTQNEKKGQARDLRRPAALVFILLRIQPQYGQEMIGSNWNPYDGQKSAFWLDFSRITLLSSVRF